eukprot:GHUV01008928.1.p1 GENE.GHUV01008928.1~~GHUV01008928.1.p1  ORF type:complete len:296 (+),score=56.73 GHUV01008928.1:130-888(+)
MECAICLNQVDIHNEAYVYPCFHRYCLSCIQQWTESQQKHQPVDQTATTYLCPLCKAPYTQIIYDCVGSTYRTMAINGQAHTGPVLPLTADQNRRRALYLTRLTKGGDMQQQQQASKRSAPRLPTHQQTSAFITRDLQAILLENDVDLIVQHVLGVLRALAAKKPDPSSNCPGSSPVYGAHSTFVQAVAQAISSFLPEQLLAESFADELWAFLHSGLTVAGYDRATFGGSSSSSSTDQEEDAPFVQADGPTE